MIDHTFDWLHDFIIGRGCCSSRADWVTCFAGMADGEGCEGIAAEQLGNFASNRVALVDYNFLDSFRCSICFRSECYLVGVVVVVAVCCDMNE